MPERSCEAFKGIRRKRTYRAAVRNAIRRLQDTSSLTPSDPLDMPNNNPVTTPDLPYLKPRPSRRRIPATGSLSASPDARAYAKQFVRQMINQDLADTVCPLDLDDHEHPVHYMTMKMLP